MAELENKKTEINYNKFPLGKMNFIIMAVSLALIVLGFILMSGSGNEGPTYNASIFDTRRVVVAPTISFIGFILMAVGIIYKGKKKAE